MGLLLKRCRRFQTRFIHAFFVCRLQRPVSVQGVMEHSLQHRDRVGVQDFVLLEDYRSEAAFINNLKKRFTENIIYVSTGDTSARFSSAKYRAIILTVRFDIIFFFASFFYRI